MKKWKRTCSDKEPAHRESQNLWQKVTSLRQSFRSKSSSKIVSNKEEKNHNFQRHWSFQRKERDRFFSNPSGSKLSLPSHTGRKQAYSFAHGSDISEWEVAKRLLDIEMSVAKRGHHRHQRSPRKLTKDSGYETSAQDYGSIEWTAQVASSRENICYQDEKSFKLEEKCSTNINQRNVERRASTESLSISRHSNRCINVESVPSCGHVTSAKSTPILSMPTRESPPPPYSPLATNVSQQQHEMVTRRFKKGLVHGAQSSNSGVNFAPATQNHQCWEKQESALHLQKSKSSESGPPGPSVPNCSFHDRSREDNTIPSTTQAMKRVPYDHSSKNADSFSSPNTINKPINAQTAVKQQLSNHEKYPSWPVTTSGIMTSIISTTSNQRSHSWTAHTDYRKERTTYSHPQKSFKIVTSQLQPVLERPSDISKKKFIDTEKSNFSNACIKKVPAESDLSRPIYTSHCIESNECRPNVNSSQLSQLGRSKERMELSQTYLNKYDSFLSHYDHHTSPPSTSGSSGYGGWSKDTCTPFLDRLRLESVSVPSEAPSEMGNWTEKTKEQLKWHGAGSYSDLSSFSVQMSNRSSLFDSGHSTMPDSGRLSPQSSCSGSILLCGIESGPRRAQVVSRHGCHRESIVHSSKVQQPQRHGSESVVYYGAHQSNNNNTKKSPSEQSKLQNKKSKSSSPNEVEICYRKNIQRLKNNDHSETSIAKLRQFSSELKVYNHSSTEEQSGFKSKSVVDKTSKPCSDKQPLSELELKTIQKQAVLSFLQRQTGKNAESNSSNQLLQWKNSLPPFKWNEMNNNKTENRQENPPKTTQYDKLKESQDYNAIGHHSRSVPNLSELRHESMNTVRASASQTPKCSLWQNQMNGKVASLATIFGGANSSQSKTTQGDVKDPLTDGVDISNATSYFHSHKTPHKAQLKEKHQATEASKIKVFNSDGVTLLEVTKRNKINEETSYSKPPQVPPRRLEKNLNLPIRQPPSRPPPPPPPPDVVEETVNTETEGIRPSALLYNCSLHYEKCPSPELPLPPPPCTDLDLCLLDEPLPPPPDPSDIDMSGHSPQGQNTPIYPKNSYMCYRSERKLGRHGFDGNYHRVSTASSSLKEPCIKVSQNDTASLSPSSWEQLHNIRQHGPTVIFHSDSIHGQLNSNEIKNCNNEFPNVSSDSNSNSFSLKDRECSATIPVCANSIERTSGDQTLPTNTTSNTPVHNLPSHLKTAEIESHKPLVLPIKNSQESVNNSHKKFPIRLKEKILETHLDSSNKTPKENFSDSSKGVNTVCSTDMCNSNADTALCHSKMVSDNQIKNEETNKLLHPAPVSVDIVPRISCATQTADTPSLRRKVKTKEELECEQLSLDFIGHCHDRTLMNLLVPLPDQKTMSDYMEGLLDIELETIRNPIQRLSVENTTTNDSSSKDGNKSEDSGLVVDNPNKTSESNLIIRYSKNIALSERTKDDELLNKKESLVSSIGRKLNKLRLEQISIREEMSQNDVLGQHVSACVEAVAKPNELEKYTLHVEELDKIMNLLLSLSGRLARAQNALINLSEEANDEDKKFLEAKRDKLSEQHEDARRLKESIDRRSQQVSTFLRQYLSKEEYADYDHFIKMKSKLLLEAREIEEKIKLGEEQLATLCNGMNWQRWKH